MKTFKQLMEMESWGSEPKMYSKEWHKHHAARLRADADKYAGIGFHVLAKHKSEEAAKHEQLAKEAKE